MKTPVTLGGRTFQVSPLNFGQLEQAMPIITGLQAGDAAAQVGKLLDFLQIALSEDYPDIVVRKLPAGSVQSMLIAVGALMNGAGFEMKVAALDGKDGVPGEGKARGRSTSRRSRSA